MPAKPKKSKVAVPAEPTQLPAEWVGSIHQGDCLETMAKLPENSIHLAFADPPFNIGYEYDEYDDRLDSESTWTGAKTGSVRFIALWLPPVPFGWQLVMSMRRN